MDVKELKKNLDFLEKTLSEMFDFKSGSEGMMDYFVKKLLTHELKFKENNKDTPKEKKISISDYMNKNEITVANFLIKEDHINAFVSFQMKLFRDYLYKDTDIDLSKLKYVYGFDLKSLQFFRATPSEFKVFNDFALFASSEDVKEAYNQVRLFINGQ